jgi:hypothetical protein
MYAIAWYARSTGNLTIVTDHIGRLHVFHAVTREGVFISTSCTALAHAVRSDPDPVAVYEMLATGTIYEDRTPICQVRRIPAASIYQFRDGLLYRAVTLQSDLLTGSSTESELSIDELTEVLENSVLGLLRGYDNPLSDLTGGLDSRLVFGLILRLHRRITVTVSGRSTDRDVRVAKALAHRIGVDIEVAGPELTQSCQQSFDSVLRAAALTEGGFDPIAYASIERIHSAHTRRYDLSLNGHGGELLRNYWWSRSHLRNPSQNILKEGAQRFVRSAIVPSIVSSEFELNLTRHFEEIVERCLQSVNRAPAYAKMAHLYLFLRMQCWLGSITSATNQIWPAASPLSQRGSLRAVLGLNPLVLLGAKAMHRIFELCPRTLSTYPLQTGFPPMAMSLPNLWRFSPGLIHSPSGLWRRLAAYGRGPGGFDSASAALVRALFASGAADYLELPKMALRFCLDPRKFNQFHRTARASGNVPLSLVGRLIALESVYRAPAASR